MTKKERIIHTVLFEAIALTLLTLGAIITTGKDAFSMGGLVVLLTVIAMFWNYGYNLAFDKVVPGNRLSRTKRTRLFHGIGFELGMVILTFPVIMWFLKTDFISVLIMDIGFVTFFFVYAIAFNWLYDIARNRFINA
ncbi:PACE efflux transporter [Parashewanella tropica]|uniref:PACE efflux transporter n=1 Tax=Parashewanella tropica TaxID=2547970 RepID=UPI001059ECD8|nr:PACE efflux transporter [Parashewanella tropica]